jgi:hypothetical protein
MPQSHQRGTTTEHSISSADAHWAPRIIVLLLCADTWNAALILLLELRVGARTLQSLSTTITPCQDYHVSGKWTES